MARNLQSPLPPAAEEFRRRTSARVIETAISWILLTEFRAYKVKKPVDLPFIDYSTPERRCHWCAEEVRLNRRYAPGLYLGVERIGEVTDNSDQSATFECAVVMRRFDEELRLDHQCQHDGLTLDEIGQLARVVVRMHSRADIAGAETPYGTPAEVLRVVLESVTELRSFFAADASELPKIESWLRTTFQQRHQDFDRRRSAGHIREGHGDLHLANLVLLDGEVVPFDCIEFSAELRWIDIASELAFTYIDLLDHRRGDLASWLLNEWLGISGDYPALAVFRFYGVYRALVRAKVAARTGDLTATSGYLRLADGLISSPEPRLLITHGLSGSGKTVASGEMLLADATASTVRIRSDVERRRMGLGYDPAATARTYRRLAEIAHHAIVDGWSVIVDAAFLRRTTREEFRQLAKGLDVPFGIVDCDAPVDVLRERIEGRRGDASEATPAVLDWQLNMQEPLTAAERQLVIDR